MKSTKLKHKDIVVYLPRKEAEELYYATMEFTRSQLVAKGEIQFRVSLFLSPFSTITFAHIKQSGGEKWLFTNMHTCLVEPEVSKKVVHELFCRVASRFTGAPFLTTMFQPRVIVIKEDRGIQMKTEKFEVEKTEQGKLVCPRCLRHCTYLIAQSQKILCYHCLTTENVLLNEHNLSDILAGRKVL